MLTVDGQCYAPNVCMPAMSKHYDYRLKVTGNAQIDL